jgi:tetratricopeptide (TPR) repeat protein
MRNWNSRRPAYSLRIESASLFTIVALFPAAVIAQDGRAGAKTDPAPNRFAPGSEVVLKLPELPIFDEGRVLSVDDHLTFTVDRSESRRLLLVSRDKRTTGWAYEDQVVPLSEAKEYFDQIFLNDIRNKETLWVLGRLCAYQNDDDRALVYLNRAVRLAPAEPSFYLSRSLIFLRKKKFREAVDDSERVVRLDPESSQGRLVREQAQKAKQEYVSAMATLEQAFRLDPTDPFTRPGVPVLKAEKGEATNLDADEAPAGENPAGSRKDPPTAAGLVASGESWYEKREYDKAISDFGAALTIDPRSAPAYAGRARTWAQKHYRERELADYDAAIRLEPGNATYRVARAETWSSRGQHGPAMADFDEAIRLDPGNPSIWVARGNEWRKDLKIELAVADFTQAIKLNPKYTPAYIARANTWKQIRRFDRAIQELSDLIRIDPDDPIPHQTLARVLSTTHEDQFRNGKWALDEASRACDLTHWIDPDAYDTLAAALAETGDFPAAIRWQTLAIKLVRQRFPSALQRKAISMGGGRGAGVGFEDRLAFYKSKKPVRE